MYNVSEEYLEALEKGVLQFDIKGRVGLVNFADSNVLEGSLAVLRQCSAKNEVSIGSVYTSQLDITLVRVSVPRNEWIGLPITIEEGLLLEDGTYEYIPVGVFNIAEATHSMSGVVVRAYDNMAKFDKAFVLSSTTGNAYDILNYICTQCGITFGMTRAQVESLPNGTAQWELDGDNDIETYRDYLSWVAQTMACFAYIDRTGKLMLKQYGSEVTMTIDSFHRKDEPKFSDFITRYTGISVVDFSSETTNYYNVEPDDGLTYNLGSNPFLQGLVKAIRDGMRRAVLNGLQNIRYTPFEIATTSAVYDLGDIIDFEDGISEGAVGCIMQIDYRYRQETKLSGYGSDPALANAKSKTDKNIAGLLANSKSDTIQFYSYLNTEEYDIPDGGWDTVISIRFASVKAGQVIFQAEILCDVDTADQIDLEVEYRLDYVTQTFRPIERWHDGDHILNLFYFIPIGANESHRWHVLLRPTGGSVHIDIDEIRATLWGQGLVGVKEWDGYIDCADEFDVIELQNQSMSVVTFTDAVRSNVQIPIGDSITEEFGVIPFVNQNMEVVEYDEVVAFNKEIAKLYLWDDIRAYNWDATENGFIWG